MKLFASSSPKESATFSGWETKPKDLRKQIIKYGKDCYKGTGKCLNYKKPKYIK